MLSVTSRLPLVHHWAETESELTNKVPLGPGEGSAEKRIRNISFRLSEGHEPEAFNKQFKRKFSED